MKKTYKIVSGYEENWQELANAIILRAVEDFRDTMNKKTLAEIEEFFLSDWFEVLTNIDGRDLLTLLRR